MESGHLAIFRRQPIVHRKQGDWRGSSQDPQGYHQIQLEWSHEAKPEEHDDRKDDSVVDNKEQAEEGEVAQIGAVGEQLDEEDEEHEGEEAAESEWNNGARGLRLRREVIGDCLVELVVVAHPEIRAVLRALVEVDLQCAQVLHERLGGPRILDMHLHLVVAVDLLLHQQFQVGEHLVPLDAWDEVGVHRVRQHLIVLLEGDVDAGGLVLHLGVTEEDGLHLHVQVGVLIRVLRSELPWIALIKFILVRGALLIVLRNGDADLLHDRGLDLKSLIDVQSRAR